MRSCRSPKTRSATIVRFYTREAGVRGLEREVSKVCRKVVKALVIGKRKAKVVVNAKNIDKYLGVHKYFLRRCRKGRTRSVR